MIHGPLQGKGTQRFALVEAWFRECMLHFSKGFKGALQVLVRLDNDGNCSLNVHAKSIPHIFALSTVLCGKIAVLPSHARRQGPGAALKWEIIRLWLLVYNKEGECRHTAGGASLRLACQLHLYDKEGEFGIEAVCKDRCDPLRERFHTILLMFS